MPTQLRELFDVRGSLSVSNGLLTYGDRIIVSKDMRPAILDKIHQGHQGIGKCLERAKDSVWWPGIAGEVKSIVASCDHCQTFKDTLRVSAPRTLGLCVFPNIFAIYACKLT